MVTNSPTQLCNMSYQLSLLDAIIQPGVYRCSVRWTNEMGYTWKPGTRIHILEHPAPDYVECCQYKELDHGQRFHLNSQRIYLYFEPVHLNK